MYPSLFNDVFGPVMIGPSSSACAGPIRIGQLARGICGGTPEKATISYLPHGYFAAHSGFGTSEGLMTGLLGYGPDDEAFYSIRTMAENAGLAVEIKIEDYENDGDADTIRLVVEGKEGRYLIHGHSIGGGMIRISRIQDFAVRQMQGEEDALLVFHKADAFSSDAIREALTRDCGLSPEAILRTETELSSGNAGDALTIVYTEKMPGRTDPLLSLPSVSAVRICGCIFPVITRGGVKKPYFSSASEMVALAEQEHVDCAELAIRYEMGRSLWGREAVRGYMKKIWRIIEGDIRLGLSGDVETERGPYHFPFGKAYRDWTESGNSFLGSLFSKTVTASIAAWDGYIDKHTLSVAGPAAGCPSIMGGAIYSVAAEYNKSEDEIVNAMFVAGALGAVAYTRTAPTAESTGCSGENGVGSAMAAGAVVQLMGGTARQIDAAAATALMNMFGLPCDCVAGGGSCIPCKGRVVAAAANAVICADMAMSGFAAGIPYDQALDALDELYRVCPPCMTGKSPEGLPNTPAAKEMAAGYSEWLKNKPTR